MERNIFLGFFFCRTRQEKGKQGKYRRTRHGWTWCLAEKERGGAIDRKLGTTGGMEVPADAHCKLFSFVLFSKSYRSWLYSDSRPWPFCFRRTFLSLFSHSRVPGMLIPNTIHGSWVSITLWFSSHVLMTRRKEGENVSQKVDYTSEPCGLLPLNLFLNVLPPSSRDLVLLFEPW
jgi:hypothetical protein